MSDSGQSAGPLVFEGESCAARGGGCDSEACTLKSRFVEAEDEAIELSLEVGSLPPGGRCSGGGPSGAGIDSGGADIMC